MSTPPSLLNLPNEILYAIIEVLDESSHRKLVLTTPHFSKPLIANYLHNGGSLLHIVTRHGRVSVAGLLKNDTDIHARANGSTALHIAAEHNHARVGDLLLKKGAEINTRTNNYHEETTLLIATRYGCVSVVGLLLNNRAHIHARANGSTALNIAAEQNHTRVAESLLKKGAEINTRTNNYREETALLIAIVRKKTKMVSLLLDFQADITSYEKLDGRTSLHLAAGQGDLEIIKLLIEHGADPNALDRKGVTPLHWASYPPSPKIAVMIIDFDANYTNDYFLWRIWGASYPPSPKVA